MNAKRNIYKFFSLVFKAEIQMLVQFVSSLPRIYLHT